jgi:serine protease Do
LDPWSEALVRAAEAAGPYVSHVTAVNTKERRGTVGSGIIIDHYHVATHPPVTENPDEIHVVVGGRKLPATVVGTDPLYAFTVLRVDGRLPAGTPPWVEADSLRAGQVVVALGDPFGHDHTVTAGVISAPDRTIYRPERFPVDGVIVTDAAIHPGNTGGPLVCLDGRIAGMNGMPWAQGLFLAIQAEVLMRVANQIIEFGRATHPWLGFSGQPEVIDPTLVALFDLPAAQGVVVTEVADGGPGQRAGVQPFDMVVRVDGRPVPHLGFIRKVLAARRPGDKGILTVLRGAELIDLEVTVEEIPRLWQSA